MKQRTALWLASALTAFALVGIGIVIGAVNTQQQTSLSGAREAQTTSTTFDAATATSPAGAGELALSSPSMSGTENSSQYQQYQVLVEEANRRLEAANQQIALLEAKVSQLEQSSSPQAQDAPQKSSVRLTPQQALRSVLMQMPAATVLRQPELVDLQGVLAYEVVLDRGMVYVDANSGDILHNTASGAQSSYKERDYREHEEHEEREEHEEKEGKEREDD